MLPVTYTNLNKDGLYYPLYGKEIGKGFRQDQGQAKGQETR